MLVVVATAVLKVVLLVRGRRAPSEPGQLLPSDSDCGSRAGRRVSAVVWVWEVALAADWPDASLAVGAAGENCRIKLSAFTVYS